MENMINATVMEFIDGEETTIVSGLYFKQLPRIGETLWFLPSNTLPACKVIDVCHWVGGNQHNVCLYTEKI